MTDHDAYFRMSRLITNTVEEESPRCGDQPREGFYVEETHRFSDGTGYSGPIRKQRWCGLERGHEGDHQDRRLTLQLGYPVTWAQARQPRPIDLVPERRGSS